MKIRVRKTAYEEVQLSAVQVRDIAISFLEAKFNVMDCRIENGRLIETEWFNGSHAWSEEKDRGEANMVDHAVLLILGLIHSRKNEENERDKKTET